MTIHYLRSGYGPGRYLPMPFGRILLPDGQLPHVVDVYRQNDQRLDAGDRIPVDIGLCTPLRVNVPCWVQPLSPQEALESMRLNLVVTHTVVFFSDPLAVNSDLLVFKRTRILVVQGINDALEIGQVWVATAREIR